MTPHDLKAQNADLRRRLEEAEETVRAIQSGAVDAFVVEEGSGDRRVYTLEGADRPYRVFVEQMPNGAVTLQPDGTIVYCNRRLAELVGVPQGRLVGAALRDFVREKDRGSIDEFVARGLERSCSLESNLVRADGGLLPALFAFKALPPDCGASVGVIITDLTKQRHHEELALAHGALRRHERLLRTASEHAQVGLFIVDPSHRYLYANGAFADLVQMSLGSIVGRHVSESLNEPCAQALSRRLDRAFAGERVQDELLFPPRTQCSGDRVCTVTFEPQEQGGSVNSVVVAVLDVTERKRAEREREELLDSERLARSEAERAARLKDEFLAVLSHELRTPLNAIVGWAHILKTDVAEPQKVRRAVEIIERNARLQAQLIADLLDMSRIISGKMHLELQRVDLAQIVSASVEAIRPSADEKGVRLLADVASTSAEVRGDPARLQQVVWNLLSNAVKFTPAGGSVQIALHNVDSRAEITVSDTGEGIPPEFLPHVFERFRQSDASATRQHGGLGLGLALVKQLVDIHGGCVHASSEGEGCGATFVVELPLRRARSAPDRRRPLARAFTRASENAPPDLSGIAVLLVDDEPDAIEMVRRLLCECDADVTTATSSAEALASAEQREFDMIVSDIGMPDMDGYEFVSELRRRGIRAPAAALTAFAGAEDRKLALSAGFQAFVTKPVEPAELIATLASLARTVSRRKR
jgi:PAS domain S-box-containing protein